MLDLLLQKLYETERKLTERNFAKDHSFEEWKEKFYDKAKHPNDNS